MYFNRKELTLVRNSFFQAEKLAERYYGLRGDDWDRHRYEIKTLYYLDDHEKTDGAFAHLFRYELERKGDGGEGGHFYRICLQDDRILDALERGSSYIKLDPLMLYIAAHEIVHVIRFDTGESDFHLPPEEKKKEEETVHRITKNLLGPVAGSDMNLVLECFSDQYLITEVYQ